MKHEEKDLLLKDLCARLPYGIICADGYGNVLELTGIDKPNTATFKCSDNTFWTTDLDKCKPYLFPLSSMTEEQFDEMHNYCYNAEREASKFSNGELKIIYNYELFKFDYLNRNKFDYRGLIPMGLAKDATGLNIY